MTCARSEQGAHLTVRSAYLCNEDDRDSLVQRSPVHVDSGAQRQHKLYHTVITAQAGGALHADLHTADLRLYAVVLTCASLLTCICGQRWGLSPGTVSPEGH